MEEQLIPISIPFKRYMDIEGKVAEYDIDYRTNDSRLEDLIEFISLPTVYRVNIRFDSNVGSVMHIIKTANQVKDCIYVRLKAEQFLAAKELKKNGIRFFFDSTMPVTNLCQLDEFIDIGVSDVYLADDLMYNFGSVCGYCRDKEVHVRLVLNRIPATTFDKGENIKSHFIRPQEVKYLKDYIDIFEFDCGEPYEWNRFNVYYRAYIEDYEWHGDLTELNQDINLPHGYPAPSMMPAAELNKLVCKRKCSFGDYCNKCEHYYNIGITMREKGVRFK